MNEIKITPEIEAEIRTWAATHQISADLLRYYVQFGCAAPQPPRLSRRGRRWLARLDRRPG